MRAYKQDHFEFNILPEGGIELVSVKDKSVTEAVIPTGVVRIGEGAFRDCAQLVTLYIPASVATIGSHAFSGCAALYDVRYEGDKSGWIGLTVEVGNQIFSTVFMTFEAEACDKGQEDENPSAVKKAITKFLSPVLNFLRSKLFLQKILPAVLGLALVIGVSLFFLTERPYNKYRDEGFICTAKGFTVTLDKYEGSKTDVVIPKEIDIIGDYAFSGGEFLTGITISEGVKRIGDGAFGNCSSITSLTIPDSVTYIGSSAFNNCYALTSITISQTVTKIGEIPFIGCVSLQSISVSSNNPNYYSVGGHLYHRGSKTLIQYALGSDDETFRIPDGVTAIGDYAFKYCDSLAFVLVPDTVTAIGDNAFENCYYLETINLPNSITSIGKSAFSGCEYLTGVEIPNGLTEIQEYTFYNCSSLTDVVIPSSITSIGEAAFADCSALASITIPNSVTSIGMGAFGGCYTLTDIHYAGTEERWSMIYSTKGDIPESTTMHYGGTINLDALAARGFAVENRDGEVVLTEYIGIDTEVAIPYCVTSIGESAFMSCTELTNIIIPDGVTSIGDYAFSWCSSLTSITIPDSVTSIGNNAFRNCDSLTSITIPNSVTSIGTSAFYYCRSLTSITIPDGITSIGYWAFYYCTNLASVMIGNGVTIIGGYAFYGCSSLTDIYYTGTEAQWNTLKNSIGSNNDYLLNATIHYNYSEE